MKKKQDVSEAQVEAFRDKTGMGQETPSLTPETGVEEYAEVKNGKTVER